MILQNELLESPKQNADFLKKCQKTEREVNKNPFDLKVIDDDVLLPPEEMVECKVSYY